MNHSVGSFCLVTIAMSVVVSGDAVGQGAERSQTIDLRNASNPTANWTTGKCAIVLGSPESGPAQGFLEVYSAVRRSDGSVAVMDAKAKKLYLYSPNGKFAVERGGRGGGPGEFGAALPAVYAYRGDSLLVFESGTGRFHVFSGAGAFARTFRVDPEPGWRPFNAIVGTLSDGKIVAVRRRDRHRADAYVERDSVSIVWLDAMGGIAAVSRDIADVLLARRSTIGPSSVARSSDGTIRSSSTETITPVGAGPVARAEGPLALGSAAFAARADVVYRFDEMRDALEVYNSAGSATRTILVRPLAANLRPSAERVTLAESVQFLELRVDELGRAWLEVARESVEGNRNWWVFDSSGRWIAVATTPPAKNVVLDITSKFMLLRQSDADDVQTVAVCPIVPR